MTMWAILKKPAASVETLATEPTAVNDGVRQLALSLQERSASLGRQAAEVRGIIDDSIAVSNHQSQAMAVLAERLGGIQNAQNSIGQQSQLCLMAMGRARETVEQVGNEVAGIVDSLRAVAEAATQITQIALQTRLVAFNASVEAKRAGEAGRGFGVVADAVKDLASQVEATSKDIMSTVGRLDSRIDSLSNDIRANQAADHRPPSAFHQALDDVEKSVLAITSAAVVMRAGALQSCDRAMYGALPLAWSVASRTPRTPVTFSSRVFSTPCLRVMSTMLQPWQPPPKLSTTMPSAVTSVRVTCPLCMANCGLMSLSITHCTRTGSGASSPGTTPLIFGARICSWPPVAIAS